MIEFQIDSDAATMQMIRSGSSKGNEVARRLNACEERSLQIEVCRFEKEHEKRMREFFNERFEVRETMKDLRQDHIKNLLSKVEKNDQSNTLQVQSLKGALELKESHVNVSYSARNNINLEVLKSPRKTGMIRSSSVPNLFTVAIKEGRKHDSKHDPRINSDKTLEVNPKTPQKTTKPCHWLTRDKTRDMKDFEEKNLENIELNCEEMFQRKSVAKSDGLRFHAANNRERIGRKSRPKTCLAIRHYTSRQFDKSLKTDGFFKDEGVQLKTKTYERRRTKSDVTPFLEVEREELHQSIRKTRPKTSLSTRYQHQNENTFSQQKLREMDRMKSFQVPKNVQFCKSLSTRPSSSCAKVCSVKFLTVSETVIATQKLIKSYRRQQAIEKATQELKAKQNSKTVTNRKSSIQSTEPEEKFKSVVTAVIAVNAFKRNPKAVKK